MDEDTVIPTENNEIVAPIGESVEPVSTPQDEEHVPLSALRKERQKRQDAEYELKWMKEQQLKTAAPPQTDDSLYESATKADLGHQKKIIIREVQEDMWIKQNPEKFAKVNELLPEFLQRRPNLTSAIENATNRYEEAWELMDKLSPRETKQLQKVAAPKRDAPGSPTGAPKAASLQQAVDVMTMNDSEFAAWRRSKKQSR